MKKLLIGLVGGFLLSHSAVAALQQSGTVTPGHLTCWTTSGIIQDCGTPATPFITGGWGITSNNQVSAGIDNAPNTGAYNQLGFGVTGSAGYITLAPFGGASGLPLNISATALNFIVNGTTYPFPGPTGPFLPISGGTLTGELITAASATGSAGFNLPQGAAPSSPANGDTWMTSAGLFYRAAGTTVGPLVGSTMASLDVTGNALVGGTLGVTGALTPSSTNGIVGTTTNDNANAGSDGEYISLNGSVLTNTPTTAGSANQTSISLTAGDWDVQAFLLDTPQSGATLTSMAIGPSTTSNTLPATQFYSTYAGISLGATISASIVSPVVRMSFATTTTVYAVGFATYTGGSNATQGFIRARRVR